MLTPEQQAEILARFYNHKQSVRFMARDLGINRKAVASVVKRRSVNLERMASNKESILLPYEDEIAELLKRDPHCRAPAVMNRLRELGYMGGDTTVKRYLRQLRGLKARPKEAFLRLDFAPGECAQVDWGEFGNVFHDGVKIHCFAMVLCHSRFIYLEFTRSEKFEDFIRGHEHAFKYFGGIPRECWYDNLGSAVTDRHGNLVRFNSRFMAYMGHHGIRPHACNVAKGNEKGRVEDLIKYIRSNFWAGRSFKDFDDLNRQSSEWRESVANQREHRSTKKIVRLHFESDEKPALLALNPHPYDTDEVFSRVVPPDFHIVYETNRYSVPWTLVGITLTVRANESSISFYYHEKLITGHTRVYEKNKVITRDKHQAGLLERKPQGKKDSWQVNAVKHIGPKMKEYVELLRCGHRSLRYELSRILALASVYGDSAVNSACDDLLKAQIIGVESLELTLKRLHDKDQKKGAAPIEFQNQKLNRITPAVDLRRYDALLFEANNQSASEIEDKNGTPETNGVDGAF